MARRARLFAAQRAAGLRHLLIFQPTSMHWLTGFEAKSYQAFQCLVSDADRERMDLFTRDGECAELADEAMLDGLHGWGAQRGVEPVQAFLALAADLRVTGPAAGIEVPNFYLHPHHHARLLAALPGISEQSDMVHDLRLVKSPREQDWLRAAGRVADLSIAALARSLRPGVSELDLAAEIYHTILRNGAEAPAVPLNLVSGPRAAYSHGAPTTRVLCSGESGNAEYCVPIRRHTVSIGRNFALGPVPDQLLRMHDAVAAAGAAMAATIRAGVPVGAPWQAAHDVLAAAGFADHISHTLGYAVSSAFPPATGERFGLAAGGKRVLEAGMMLSLAPNVFDATARLGARVVNNILVTEAGVEWLTRAETGLLGQT